ncbi:uncharacterized protein LOC121688433 isoform X1 [Alosa sapidissima]|uniref:uncharacterized protein LOC121688433 isoform X1 n=1 Tax=Alosa sapidissima TaxID=34773 RepID=UPI001C0872A9|nr:uncharacterized protein LOC121688433 isoform X1 [Alosa sapidissima]
MGHTGTEKPTSTPTAKARLCYSGSKQHFNLPRGLIGHKCTANITISGVHCNSLLDTGSQVTTVSLSFYRDHLSHQPIQPMNHLLEVEGANGQSVPYLGYVELKIAFPKEFIESEPEIVTLALVIPDIRSSSDIPVLVGTNTLDMLYDEHCDHNTTSLTSPLPVYSQILKMLALRKEQRTSGHHGILTMREKQPRVIPAGWKVPLEGHVSTSNITAEHCALIEQPTTSALPGGIFVDTCLVTLPSQHPHKLPVWVRNETEHDITLPANCVIAELTIPHDIISSPSLESKPSERVKCCQLSYQQPRSAETPDLTFDFGDSPLPESWKNRVTHKLNQFSDIFAHHELDYGQATRVKHHIKLKDETPFKQRSRPIHPQDYEAVRNHLRTLLEAGIIRESESPYSSPIVVVRKKSGDVRLCVDYRKLNNQTIKDAYALPNVEETFSALSGSQ